jgi:hypothetical protein
MHRGHTLLTSEQYGLGRSSLVRFAAYLTRMKYYESRVTNDQAQSETYLKSVMRQCCLMSGIKGSHTIVYVKAEYHSHRILENLCTFVKTGKFFITNVVYSSIRTSTFFRILDWMGD